MHALVRDLYKRFLLAGKNYPQGLDYVRKIVKEAFLKSKDLENEIDIKKCIAKGRYEARQLQYFNQFHKYRLMKKRYEK